VIRYLLVLVALLGAAYVAYHKLTAHEPPTSAELSVHGVRVGMSAEAVRQILGAPEPTGDGDYTYAYKAVFVAYTPRRDEISRATVPGNVKLVHGTNVERGDEVVATKATLRRNVVDTLGKPSEEGADFVAYDGPGWRLRISFDGEGPDGRLTFADMSAR